MADEHQLAAYWSEAWRKHIHAYLAAPPRAGYWMARRFSRRTTFLEIAGGSCRDSRYLAACGRSAVGSDFDEKTLAYIRELDETVNLRVQKEDAFALSFESKSFDVSFSNGFWILFSNDEQLRALLREQVRVTRRCVIALVHNGENSDLRDRFAKKGESDSLYAVRFFRRSELENIVCTSGIAFRKLEFFKFGGLADRLFKQQLKGVPNPIRTWAPFFVPSLYDFQPWSRTERIGCAIWLS